MRRNDRYLFNVSFGILLFMPLGWFIIIAVLAIETIAMSKYLIKEFYDKSIMKSTVTANIISGIVGVVLSMYQNGGWWLVCWFPWVSKHEVTNKSQIQPFIIYFVIAFVLSVVIECIVNYIFLRKKYGKKNIVKSTVVANVCSYIPIVVLLYIFSFTV